MTPPASGDKKPKELPGILQSFQEIIAYNRLYVDKTPYIYSMVKDRALNYLFLSRPRRFGKTLLLDTLSELFSGHRHLFENLRIGRETDYDFKPHPVIRLSMNYAETDSPGQLKAAIKNELLRAAKSLDIPVTSKSYSLILKDFLADLYDKYGAGAVILIDEYDAPVAGHIEKPALAQANS
jgi:hypothetical protein